MAESWVVYITGRHGARKLPVRSITLFAVGGVAQIEKEAGDPRTEFWMGIAGPIVSAVIGGLCLTLAAALGWSPAETPDSPFLAMLMWLGLINLSLAQNETTGDFGSYCLADRLLITSQRSDNGH